MNSNLFTFASYQPLMSRILGTYSYLFSSSSVSLNNVYTDSFPFHTHRSLSGCLDGHLFIHIMVDMNSERCQSGHLLVV